MTKGCRHMGRGVFSVCVLCRADTPRPRECPQQRPWSLGLGEWNSRGRTEDFFCFAFFLILPCSQKDLKLEPG